MARFEMLNLFFPFCYFKMACYPGFCIYFWHVCAVHSTFRTGLWFLDAVCWLGCSCMMYGKVFSIECRVLTERHGYGGF